MCGAAVGITATTGGYLAGNLGTKNYSNTDLAINIFGGAMGGGFGGFFQKVLGRVAQYGRHAPVMRRNPGDYTGRHRR